MLGESKSLIIMRNIRWLRPNNYGQTKKLAPRICILFGGLKNLRSVPVPINIITSDKPNFISYNNFVSGTTKVAGWAVAIYLVGTYGIMPLLEARFSKTALPPPPPPPPPPHSPPNMFYMGHGSYINNYQCPELVANKIIKYQPVVISKPPSGLQMNTGPEYEFELPNNTEASDIDDSPNDSNILSNSKDKLELAKDGKTNDLEASDIDDSPNDSNILSNSKDKLELAKDGKTNDLEGDIEDSTNEQGIP